MPSPETKPDPIPHPSDEEQRLAALQRCQLLDTPAEDDFDFLTALAAHVCDTPYAFVSLVDRDRVWIKSYFGMQAQSRPRDDDYCSWAILEDATLSIPDLSEDPRTASISMTIGPPRYRMYTAANLLTSDGYRIGSLCVLDNRPRTLAEQQVQLLLRLSRQVMALIELRAHQRALAAALSTMERLATIDELTGLWNRRVLLERLDIEVERARRFGTPLSLIMMDIDHFKSINDRHGHAMGDAVLRNIGGIVRDELRQVDIAGRYGGEEFCIVLPGTPHSGGITLAEALRQEVEHFVHAHEAHSLSATASFGLASLEDDAEDDATVLLKAADDALYRAKGNGRNRVECAVNAPDD
ncbi:MAG TPA: sensor domain-containing diguanylate cyclase [Xanthomonadaceae bacterium]|jgi:diguanylate cyclase (GGDEF)-like protein|nr:sensor domain-containing diguanylate cyclase [Xanthomonadaceae bacterium]